MRPRAMPRTVVRVSMRASSRGRGSRSNRGRPRRSCRRPAASPSRTMSARRPPRPFSARHHTGARQLFEVLARRAVAHAAHDDVADRERPADQRVEVDAFGDEVAARLVLADRHALVVCGRRSPSRAISVTSRPRLPVVGERAGLRRVPVTREPGSGDRRDLVVALPSARRASARCRSRRAFRSCAIPSRDRASSPSHFRSGARPSCPLRRRRSGTAPRVSTARSPVGPTSGTGASPSTSTSTSSSWSIT